MDRIHITKRQPFLHDALEESISTRILGGLKKHKTLCIPQNYRSKVIHPWIIQVNRWVVTLDFQVRKAAIEVGQAEVHCGQSQSV